MQTFNECRFNKTSIAFKGVILMVPSMLQHTLTLDLVKIAFDLDQSDLNGAHHHKLHEKLGRGGPHYTGREDLIKQVYSQRTIFSPSPYIAPNALLHSQRDFHVFSILFLMCWVQVSVLPRITLCTPPTLKVPA